MLSSFALAQTGSTSLYRQTGRGLSSPMAQSEPHRHSVPSVLWTASDWSRFVLAMTRFSCSRSGPRLLRPGPATTGTLSVWPNAGWMCREVEETVLTTPTEDVSRSLDGWTLRMPPTRKASRCTATCTTFGVKATNRHYRTATSAGDPRAPIPGLRRPLWGGSLTRELTQGWNLNGFYHNSRARLDFDCISLINLEQGEMTVLYFGRDRKPDLPASTPLNTMLLVNMMNSQGQARLVEETVREHRRLNDDEKTDSWVFMLSCRELFDLTWAQQPLKK